MEVEGKKICTAVVDFHLRLIAQRGPGEGAGTGLTLSPLRAQAHCTAMPQDRLCKVFLLSGDFTF